VAFDAVSRRLELLKLEGLGFSQAEIPRFATEHGVTLLYLSLKNGDAFDSYFPNK